MELKRDAIDVWKIRWRDVPAEDAVAFLTAEEREKAERFKIADDRGRNIVARAALRRLAARYLGGDPGIIETTAHGKPYWRDHADRLSFNVSHSGEWVLIAFAPGARIGVDVQEIDGGPRFRGEKVVKYAYHPAEKDAVEACPEAEKRDLFYGIWTCKEAVIKAAGLGLHGELEKFNILPLPNEEEWTSINSHNILNDTGGLICRALAVDAQHKGALAVDGFEKSCKINIFGDFAL